MCNVHVQGVEDVSFFIMVDICTPQRLARFSRVCAARMSGLRIVLDGLADPGNRAAVLRTSEALGLLHVHVVPCSQARPAPMRKKHARSITTGSEKWLKVHYHKDASECIAELRGVGFEQILTAKPPNPENDTCHQPRALQEIDFAKRTALVFGHEKHGISPLMSSQCDGDFHIPMLGLTESFNVSVAAAICIHWGRSAREKTLGGTASDLSDLEREELLLEYVNKNFRQDIIRYMSLHACAARLPILAYRLWIMRACLPCAVCCQTS
jgi:tRNA (guanosine-2'-O-)-methyltransferase